MKAYKIRKFQNGRNKDGVPFINYSLTIPSVIAEQLPKDMKFACELTEEGLLFRPASATEEQNIELPAWAAQAKANGRGAKRTRPKPRAKSKA